MANSPEMREGRGTLTDEQGQFELKELPAGRYTLTAMKSGYVALSYGQRRPVETPRPLVLGDKLVLEKIDFHLPRGGVVTGRVLDEFGEPVSEVMVQVSRFRYLGGQRRLLNAGRSNQTDDLGQFRVYGLPPGEYYISAGLMPGMMNQGISGISTGYATTYYPGTPSLSEAQRITVGVGQETSNIVFSLSPARKQRLPAACSAPRASRLVVCSSCCDNRVRTEWCLEAEALRHVLTEPSSSPASRQVITPSTCDQ